MGWASGSYLANDLWELIREHIADENKKEVATKIYQMFCERDADDWDSTDELVLYAKGKLND